MKGFKGFNKDLKCRGFQFEQGKEYKEEKAECCETGFHFCENPLDVFGYYPPSNSRYCEVEGSGQIDKENRDDSKVAASQIKIGLEIGLPGLIKAGVEYIKSNVDWENAKETNTGYQSVATNTGDYSAATNTGNKSAATNTGDYSAATNTGNKSAATNTGNKSAATNTGYQSVATNTGYQSAATNTGDYSAATNTGYQSVATNTGYQSAATNTGNKSVATNTGYQSAATNTGDYSAATNTGNKSAATNTGNKSVATNTGDYSAATVEGNESIACALGMQAKAKGKIGCWIVLAEWEEVGFCDKKLKQVKAFEIDGEIIKEDIFYVLENGQAIEFKED